MTLSDKNLIKKIKNGSQFAFKDLYLKYSDLLFAFISSQIDNNKESALEIWQDTWVIAVEKIYDFQFKSSVFTWLCAIAKNKISDYYRLIEKHRKYNEDSKTAIDIDNEDIIQIDDVIKSDVISVLADLKDEHRYLLMQRYYENKSVEEISLAIGKSYKATESMLSRSREAFRNKFKNYNCEL